MRTSDFSKKIRMGMRPTDADWEGHLQLAHAAEPRLTPEAFSGGRTPDGQNSYQVLANELKGVTGDVSVLDLGCGDGHLLLELLPRLSLGSQVTAVDMAPDALMIAREEIRDPRVQFVQARAQELPLPNHSYDFIFSHMAFMLMSPIEPVVSEIRRVLKPGGVFSAVTGSGQAIGLYKDVRRLLSLFVQAHIPAYINARENRASEAAFTEGFEPNGDVKEFQLEFHVPPQGLWRYVEGLYFTAVFSDAAKRELKDEIMALASDHAAADGRVHFSVPMRRFSVRALS